MDVITLTSASFHRTTIAPVMMVVSLVLAMLAGTLVETVKQVHVIMSMNVLKLSTHTHKVSNSNCFDIQGSNECHCLPSFHMVRGACVVDDECTTNNNDCHESRSVCTNEAKTYTMEWVSGVAQYTMSGRAFSYACNLGYSYDNLNSPGTIVPSGDVFSIFYHVTLRALCLGS